MGIAETVGKRQVGKGEQAVPTKGVVVGGETPLTVAAGFAVEVGVLSVTTGVEVP